jgi:uncharacterized phiE125 gp8 family phage protein
VSALCALADVKAFLGITGSATDAVLQSLVTNASALIESYCSRVFARATYTETRNGNGGSRLFLANSPVSAVSAVAIDGQTIPAASGPLTTGYAFDAGVIYLRGYCFNRGVQNVTVSYTAGFATVPADVAQACIELVAAKFAKRDRIDKQSETLGTQQTISYSMADMPAQVKAALNPYVQVAKP